MRRSICLGLLLTAACSLAMVSETHAQLEINSSRIEWLPAMNFRIKNSTVIKSELLVSPIAFAIVNDEVPLPKNADGFEIDWDHIKNLDINPKPDDKFEFGGGHFCPDDYPKELDGENGVKYKFTYCYTPENPVAGEPYRVEVKVKKCTPDPKGGDPTVEDIPCRKLGKRKKWTNWPTDWEKDKEITAIITQCWNAVKCDAKPEEGGDCKRGEIDCENNGHAIRFDGYWFHIRKKVSPSGS